MTAKKQNQMTEEEKKFYTNLGFKLRNYMNHYNISVIYMSKLLNLHRETIYMTLDGRRKLTAHELLIYAQVLKTSIDELTDNDPKYYLDEAFIGEYQKLNPEDKKEIYNFCKFKNSLRDRKEIYEEINHKEDKEDKQEDKFIILNDNIK